MPENAEATATESKREGFFGRIFRESAQAAKASPSALNLEDIQGFILRGYRMPMVRHFLLQVGVAAEARKLLGRFVSGDESDAPQITTARDWHVGFGPGPADDQSDPPRRKPDYCLNLGITWPGMLALELKDRLPTLAFKSFDAFVAGAAERAKLVGDTGPSGPENWIGGFGKGGDHVLITLHALSPESLTSYSDRLSALFAEGGAFREVWRRDGMALMETRDGKSVPTTKVHFGYTDGISMTTIRGGPEHYPPDHQQPCEPWLFVLIDGAENYFVPEPRELGLHGSFAVFKMIETDVVGFENFLQANKRKSTRNCSPPRCAGAGAMACRSHCRRIPTAPLAAIAPERMNDFDYVNADGSGDPRGVRCPVGAHMRRINPRGQPVAGQGHNGGSNNTHRLIRRGMPYGPAYDPSRPHDGVERGLLGYFINSNIENQYEFVLSQWVNDAAFAGAVRLDPKVQGSDDWNSGPGREHFRHSAGERRASDQDHRAYELHDDQSGRLLLPAEHHRNQVHRGPLNDRRSRRTSQVRSRSSSCCP